MKELGLPINSTPSDYRSVHTALLTGLLSHIGQKDADKQEFTGARNARFSIFPGSGLFKKPPKWTMVAELVETSRLWGASPRALNRNGLSRWLSTGETQLQRAALVEIAGAVMASEKSRCSVCRSSRRASQLRLHRSAAVPRAVYPPCAGGGRLADAPRLLPRKPKLRAEVEELEHKSRRRDILVDDETLFGFYDRRIPNDVVSGRHFDSWWKSAAKQQPDLLNFEKEMIKDGANKISALDYPNFWHQGNLKLRLSYQFEPGTDADGVTVHIPLPILNRGGAGLRMADPRHPPRAGDCADQVAAEAGAPQLRAGTELRRGVPWPRHRAGIAAAGRAGARAAAHDRCDRVT